MALVRTSIVLGPMAENGLLPSASFKSSFCRLISACVFGRNCPPDSFLLPQTLQPPVLLRQIFHLANQRCIPLTHALHVLPGSACRQIWPATCKRRRDSSHAPGTVQRPAHHPLPVQYAPSRQIAAQSPAGQCVICASLYRAVFIKNLLRYLAEKILLLNTMDSAGQCNTQCRSLDLEVCVDGKAVADE